MKFVEQEPKVGSTIKIKSFLELQEFAKNRGFNSLSTVVKPNSIYTIYDIAKSGSEKIYRIKKNDNNNVIIYREEFDLI